MSKTIASLVGSLVFLFSVAGRADNVYSTDYGSWHLRGYKDAVNVGDDSCVLSTQWNDGKRIQVNVFPRPDGTANVTMTLLNPLWNNSPWSDGQKFTVRIDFQSGKYGTVESIGQATVYGQQKIIFRGLNRVFAHNFIHFDAMTMFAGTPQQVVVNLDGTAALAGALSDCISTVTGVADTGNH